MFKKATTLITLLIINAMQFSAIAGSGNEETAAANITTIPLTSFNVEYYSQSFGYDISTILFPTLFTHIDDWIGTPYRYGGKTDDGIDCSGFVSSMLESAFGINFTGRSRDMFTRVDPVSKTEMRQGDLVFFKIRKGQISHVGIYIGDNKFAHASTSSGVIISDLNEAYYKRYFYKAGRLDSIANL